MGTHLDRRTMLQLMGSAAVLPVIVGHASDASAAPAARRGTTLVDSGQGVAVIVSPPAPDPQVQNATGVLASYVQQATGASLPVITEAEIGSYPGKTLVYVGFTGANGDSDVSRALAKLGPDGYVIKVDSNVVFIVGPTVWGTRFGVYEFLERFVGVRWLLPGPNGADVPLAESLAVPAQFIQDEPAYASRVIYNLGIGTSWASADPLALYGTFLRTHLSNPGDAGGTGYSHNMGNIFPPSLYGDPSKPDTYHPEYYPIINGQRYIPPTASFVGWQPRFTEPGTVDVAVEYVLARLAANPQEWVSLGVNDSNGYSDEELTLAHLDEYGMYSVSETYYAWVNAVAERVAARYSGEFHLGLLAYDQVWSPPSFRLHPSVTPYITRDRYGWVDPRTAAADRKVHQEWMRRASSLGWWDYPFGSPYSVPRVYGDALGQALRYGARNKVVAVFAEMNPNLGEGPKPWIYAKLLWNPDQDPKALLREWCARAVGPAAAPAATKYFELWEQFWSTSVPKSPWFRAGGNLGYYNFTNPAYLELTTSGQLATARQLLEQTVERSATDPQRARAQTLMNVFEYYEATALSYPHHTAVPTSADAASQLFEAAISGLDASVAYATKRIDLLNQFAADPVLKFSLDPRSYGLVWSGWNLYTLWDVANYIRANPDETAALRRRVEAVAAGGATSDTQGYASLLLDIADGKTRQLALNPSFEDATIAPWGVDNAGPFPQPPQVSTATSHSGRQSLQVVSASGGGIHQQVAATPGFFRASFWFRATPQVSGPGYVEPVWLTYDASGRLLQEFIGDLYALADSDDWREAVMAQMLPEGTASIACYLSTNSMTAHTTLYVDDASFIQTSG